MHGFSSFGSQFLDSDLFRSDLDRTNYMQTSALKQAEATYPNDVQRTRRRE
jgi:hypothetical protein